MAEKNEPRVSLGFRVPAEIDRKLREMAKKTEREKSALVVEALAKYLDVEVEASLPDRITQLENRLDKNEEQVRAILGKFQRLATTR
jgi:predicted transcriptional regulator